MVFVAASPGINRLRRNREHKVFKVEWQNGKAVRQYTGYGLNGSKKPHKERKKLLLWVRV